MAENETQGQKTGERAGNQQRKNARVLAAILGIPVVMTGVAFASVPLYDLFCRVTGFGGTTQVSAGTTGEVLDRTMEVRFVTNTGRGMPWEFGAEMREMEVQVGEPGLVFYNVANTADRPTAGVAVYNVSPPKAGIYFNKVQCFCFEEQILNPGETAEFPVYFFLDPALADDPNMDDVTVVTLSYTYYESQSDELDAAMQAYYDAVSQANTPPAGS